MIQRKRVSAPRFFIYDEKNLFKYNQVVETIDYSLEPKDILKRMILMEEFEGYSYYIARIINHYKTIYNILLYNVDRKRAKERFVSNLRDYLKACSSPEGIDNLKDSVLASFRTDACEVLDDAQDWINDVGKNYSFNITSAFPWFIDQGDWKLSLEEPVCDSSSERLHGKLPAVNMDIALSKKLRLYKDSVTCENGNRFHRLSKFSEQKKINETFFSDHEQIGLEYLRTLTFVSPGNIRDTYIPTRETLVILTELEEIIGKIIEKIPEIRIGKRWVEPPSCPYYMMIDIKKFGITFPHSKLIETLQSVERSMNIDLSFYINALKNQRLSVDGKMFSISRGFGLGNLNKTATLAHYFLAKQVGLPFYVYSDDIVYGVPEYIPGILQETVRLYEAHGFLVNRKKCCISSDWEFLGQSSHIDYSVHEAINEVAVLDSAIFEEESTEYAIESQYLSCKTKIPIREVRSVFFQNHSISPLENYRLLLPFQSGGYLTVKDYGKWIEENPYQPVVRYVPRRKSVQRYEYSEVEKEETFVDYYVSKVPIDYVYKRPQKGKEKVVSYPYRYLDKVSLFKKLLEEGHHPVGLLVPHSRLTNMQSRPLGILRLEHPDPRYQFRVPQVYLENFYEHERSAIKLLSNFCEFPRQKLGEYHRKYKCTFTSEYNFYDSSSMELKLIEQYANFREQVSLADTDPNTLAYRPRYPEFKLENFIISDETLTFNVSDILKERITYDADNLVQVETLFDECSECYPPSEFEEEESCCFEEEEDFPVDI